MIDLTPENLKAELKKPHVAIGLGLIALMCFVKYMIQPWLEWRSESIDYIEQQRSNIRPTEVVKHAIAVLKREQQELDNVKNELKKNYFEGTPQALEVELQKLVEKLAVKNQIEVRNRSARADRDSKFINRVEMDIVGSGPLNGVEQFIYEIESNKHVVLIESVVLQKVGRYKDELRMTLKLVSYATNNEAEEYE